MKGSDADLAVGEIFLAEQASVSGDVLVLLADGFTEAVHFNLDGFACKGLSGNGLPLPCVESMEQADQESTGRTEARAGRNIGDADDFKG